MDEEEVVMEPKYEITGDSITLHETLHTHGSSHHEDRYTTLYRIRAIGSSAPVGYGTLGGYIESEANLSHEGSCWVYDNSVVCDKASVSGSAAISGHSFIVDNSIVKGGRISASRLSGYSCVTGSSEISDCILYGAEVNSGQAHSCILKENSGISGASISDITLGYGARINGTDVGGPLNIPAIAVIDKPDEYVVIKPRTIKRGKIILFRTDLYEIMVRFDHNTYTMLQFETILRRIYQGEFFGTTVMRYEYDQIVETCEIYKKLIRDRAKKEQSRLIRRYIK